jgi:hypothetical protein
MVGAVGADVGAGVGMGVGEQTYVTSPDTTTGRAAGLASTTVPHSKRGR